MAPLLVLALLAAHPLHGSTAGDGAATATAAAAWGTLSLLAPDLAPRHCKWCDTDAAGHDALNGLDRAGEALIWSDRHAAEVASNVLMGALPLGIVGADFGLASRDDARGDVPQDLLLLGEVLAVQGAINQGVKLLAGRQRPYAHLGGASGTDDDNVSFYSGHTSTAFALVTSAGVLATLRGYGRQGLIWGVGLPLATAIALLRVAAAKHYVTDVLVGAAVGTAIGLALPLLFHGRAPEEMVGTPPPPAQLGFAFTF